MCDLVLKGYQPTRWSLRADIQGSMTFEPKLNSSTYSTGRRPLKLSHDHTTGHRLCPCLPTSSLLPKGMGRVGRKGPLHEGSVCLSSTTGGVAPGGSPASQLFSWCVPMSNPGEATRPAVLRGKEEGIWYQQQLLMYRPEFWGSENSQTLGCSPTWQASPLTTSHWAAPRLCPHPPLQGQWAPLLLRMMSVFSLPSASTCLKPPSPHLQLTEHFRVGAFSSHGA